MKLIRVGEKGREKPGIVDENGDIRDLSDLIDDWDNYSINDEVFNQLRKVDLSTLPRLDPRTRIGPCVAGVGKFVCVGLNYAAHRGDMANIDAPENPRLQAFLAKVLV